MSHTRLSEFVFKIQNNSPIKVLFFYMISLQFNNDSLQNFPLTKAVSLPDPAAVPTTPNTLAPSLGLT